MIFKCNNCGFVFERTAEPSQCPNCGKENIEPAKTEEQIKYLSSKEKNGKDRQDTKQ
jgi:predicted  nucleic acid-binding Zn-ribbon protein